MQTEGASGVRLWDLRRTSCRWPLGGAWEHAEFFCGEPIVSGCSWCKEHRLRAYSRATATVKSHRTPMILKDRRR
jgi:hypothetical protein